jgi:hypothetical protein
MLRSKNFSQGHGFFIWSLIRIFMFLSLSSLFGFFIIESISEREAEIIVEQFLIALAEKDDVVISNISCPEWEEDALLELDALQLVKSTITDLDCFTSKSTENGLLIFCNGFFSNSYNNENTVWDLSLYVFDVSNTSGAYLLCGFSQK